MAIQKHVVFTDDLNGSDKDVKTVTFGFEGKTFEIDLGTLNRHNLEKSLTKYMQVARPVKSAKRTVSQGSKSDLTAVRAWAQENGHDVAERGRISAVVMHAYAEAHAPATV